MPARTETQHENIDIYRIVTDYHASLLRMAFFYLKDEHLAEDAVQEAFIRIFKYQNSFRSESSEKTWITKITINVCKQFLRSSWKRHADCSEALESIPAEDEAAKSDDTVITEVMKLPEKYKDVVLLFYYQGLKIKEIARALEISQSAVSARLSRAREKLNKKLKGWYFNE